MSSEQTSLMKTAEIKDGKERLAKVNDYSCVMSAKTKQAGQGGNTGNVSSKRLR